MGAGGEELSGACPDLGQDRRCGDRANPRDCHQELPLPGERDHHLLHLRIQPGDHLLKMVDVFEVQLTHQRVVGIETALQRQREIRDLRPHPAPGQLGQHHPAAFAVDEGFDHRPTRDGGDGGGNRVQFDPRILQHRT